MPPTTKKGAKHHLDSYGFWRDQVLYCQAAIDMAERAHLTPAVQSVIRNLKKECYRSLKKMDEAERKLLALATPPARG